ncbi:MAG: tetratricopeptide repeat protein [Aestuariivirga sp.]|uniref:tetratricopeptide repeat protein n=1 Tax=Aestuariivirga sp. TaxID=2650926 RepID=UPI0025C1B218|nr:tetratricopeptide repeat protein [Aestuariivirga sp.]MCA3560524.1 tetratricopeptide repeat protein [Aestuariivirga sp.]
MSRIVPVALAFLIAVAAPAFAAGGGSSGGGSSSPTNHGCKKGQVWNAKTKKCVATQSGILPDEELYQQGRALAKEAQYDWAIQVLATIQNQEDPRVLNYLGYSNRKAGRLETGITYYRQALAIDPNFNLAREYLGEGYIAAGRVDLAMAELAAIEKSCGTACEEYKDLSAAIAAAN